nr:hypothetical protein Iba_chr04aCG23740 [Ipomoea batatas]
MNSRRAAISCCSSCERNLVAGSPERNAVQTLRTPLFTSTEPWSILCKLCRRGSWSPSELRGSSSSFRNAAVRVSIIPIAFSTGENSSDSDLITKSRYLTAESTVSFEAPYPSTSAAEASEVISLLTMGQILHACRKKGASARGHNLRAYNQQTIFMSRLAMLSTKDHRFSPNPSGEATSAFSGSPHSTNKLRLLDSSAISSSDFRSRRASPLSSSVPSDFICVTWTSDINSDNVIVNMTLNLAVCVKQEKEL